MAHLAAPQANKVNEMQFYWRVLAAIAFYTSIPLPLPATLEFRDVSRLAPLIGGLLGLGLCVIDWGLAQVGLEVWPRSTVVVLLALAVTGGLHLDGAMDTADGLAVQNPERRLAVMTDSATGAFGAMAAIAILLLKITCLASLSHGRLWALLLAPIWGRWSQQVAIARYPYLKPTGKGAFHKQALPTQWSMLPGLLWPLLGISVACGFGLPLQDGTALMGMGGAIALMVPAWFHHQLGGHTGDTYGASVEWTEALFLLWAALWL